MLTNRILTVLYNEDRSLYEFLSPGHLVKFMGFREGVVSAIVDIGREKELYWMEIVPPGKHLLHMNLSDFVGTTGFDAVFLRSDK